MRTRYSGTHWAQRLRELEEKRAEMGDTQRFSALLTRAVGELYGLPGNHILSPEELRDLREFVEKEPDRIRVWAEFSDTSASGPYTVGADTLDDSEPDERRDNGKNSDLTVRIPRTAKSQWEDEY